MLLRRQRAEYRRAERYMGFHFTTTDLINFFIISIGVGTCGLNFMQAEYSAQMLKGVRIHLQLFCAALIGYLVAALGKCILDGIPGSNIRSTLLVLAFLEPWMCGIATYMLSNLLLIIAHSKNMRRISYVFLTINCLNTVMLVANLRLNVLYYLDAANAFHQGSMYLMLGFFNGIQMVIDAFLLILYRNKFGGRVRLAFWLYITLPVPSLLAQVVFPELKLICFTTIGTAIFTNFCIVRDQNEKSETQMQESSRIAAELNMAAGIQTHMLPNVFPAFPERDEFDIYATMHPAKEVGGDFYDFFMIGEDHLGIVVADVSGKGVPAALFSMIAKTMLKTQAQTRLSPDRVLMEVNASLCENNEEEMFVTVWLGVLEISTGLLTYADAGHEKLLLYQNGEWTLLPKAGGFALAAYTPEDIEMLGEDVGFRNQTIQLRPGDAILQYTDGVTEAKNMKKEQFGEKRLLKAVNGAPSAVPEELLPYIRKKIDEFVLGAPQFDDITMLGLRMNG